MKIKTMNYALTKRRYVKKADTRLRVVGVRTDGRLVVVTPDGETQVI